MSKVYDCHCLQWILTKVFFINLVWINNFFKNWHEPICIIIILLVEINYT